MKIVVKNLEGLLECFIPKRYATKMLGEALEVVNQFEDIDGLTCYEIKADYAFSDERAESIARTETAIADVEGNVALMKSLDWLSISNGSLHQVVAQNALHCLM